jgi:branched-chain amino acid transport system ATP-binding protein
LLTIENIDCYYGDFQALRDVSLHVPEGKIFSLLGPNAAGKSTTLRSISGIVRHRGGRITFDGEPIGTRKPEDIVEMGIAHVPEGRKLFSTMTVKENLEMGAYSRRAKPQVKASLEKMFSLFPVLADRRNQMAGSLSGGEQQMCAIGRGLMAVPRLLMIDEMSLGLSPLLVQQMFAMVKTIAATGVTIFLVEQQVHQTMAIADIACVMEKGHIVLAGPTSEISGHPHVKKAYLGM